MITTRAGPPKGLRRAASVGFEGAGVRRFPTGQLDQLVRLQRGHDLPASRRCPGEVPVIGATGQVGSHSDGRGPVPGVVIGRSGVVGGATLVRVPYWPLNTTLYAASFLGNDPVYTYYVLKSLRLDEFSSGSAQPSLNRNYIAKVPVPRPEPGVQAKVASALIAYDDLIENNSRRIAILEEMAQAIYREWFVEFRFPGHEGMRMEDSELGPIPEGWRIVSFTDVATVLSGGTPSTKVGEYWDGDIPFFTPRDAGALCIVSSTEKAVTQLGLDHCASRLYPPGTVFVTARGTDGKAVTPSVPMAMNQSCYAMQSRLPASDDFLLWLLRDKGNYLRANRGGATFGTVVTDTFKRMRVMLPPSELIEKFAAAAAGSRLLEANLLAQNQGLRSARDLLLPRLISGEIDVSDLDIDNGD